MVVGAPVPLPFSAVPAPALVSAGAAAAAAAVGVGVLDASRADAGAGAAEDAVVAGLGFWPPLPDCSVASVFKLTACAEEMLAGSETWGACEVVEKEGTAVFVGVSGVVVNLDPGSAVFGSEVSGVKVAFGCSSGADAFTFLEEGAAPGTGAGGAGRSS